jgi:ATP-dependent exoDNAse (exonuclease V) beta subunit
MNFVVYKSSAGSGKTFTLVKEYIKLILVNPNRFRNILAITFTNKAANEMKERVLKGLKEIAVADSIKDSSAVKIMLPLLVKETALPVETIIANSQKALELILHGFSDFAITTIDSFVHRIIRSFAFDLNIPLNFEVEIESEELLQKVIDLLISQAGSNDKLTNLLVNFVNSKITDEKSWHIEGDLLKTAKLLLDDDGQEYVDKLINLEPEDFKLITQKLEKAISFFEKQVIQISKSVVTEIINRNIDHSSFSRGNSGISKYFENLSQGNFYRILPNSYVVATIEEDKWFSAKASTDDQNAILQIKDLIITAYDQLQDLIGNAYAQYILHKEIRNNIYPLAVIKEIDRVMKAFKEDNSIVLIDEFNRKISDIVMNEPAPFIYERLGEKYQHYLIDEFQDTSVLQWYNLLPLIENSLGSNHFNMIVGDGKQSIYRWRNGAVEQFASLPGVPGSDEDELIRTREQSLVRNYQGEVLKNNFRSKAEIVSFNNDFFKTVSQDISQEYLSIYDDVEQQFIQAKTGGGVSIQFPEVTMDATEYAEWNLEKIHATVTELIAEGYNQEDIAILCRSNKNASEIAGFLLQNNFNVVSSESLLLSSSPEVKFLISTAGFLVNKSDKVRILEMLVFLSNNNYLNQPFPEILSDVFKDKDPADKLLEKLAEKQIAIDHDLLLKLSVYDLFEALIRCFKLNSNPDTYLQFLLDAILKFSQKEDSTLNDFLSYWDIKGSKLSIIVSEGLDAIRIMTIHKAKGLEFPVVIFPFANTKLKLTKKELWIDFESDEIPQLKVALVNTKENLLETEIAERYKSEKDKSELDLINLLYVVMTRPTERLYIFSEQSPKSKTSAKSYSKIFRSYLEGKGIWLNNQYQYSFGEFVSPVQSTSRKELSLSLHQFISNPWNSRMRIRHQAPDFWDLENPMAASEYGKLIHLVLSEIKTLEDADIVLAGFVKQGIVQKSESDKIMQQLLIYLSNPEISKFFKAGLKMKSEKDILLPNGHTIRPDRLIFDKDEVIIIDFKTGAVSPKHLDQIQEYKIALMELGYQKVQCVLIYLLNKGVVKYV